MTKVEAARKIVSQEGFCRGTRCTDCPLLPVRCGADEDGADRNKRIEFLTSWLLANDKLEPPRFEVGKYVAFVRTGERGEGYIVGKTHTNEWSVRITKRITPGTWGHSDYSRAEPHGGDNYWNVAESEMTPAVPARSHYPGRTPEMVDTAKRMLGQKSCNGMGCGECPASRDRGFSDSCNHRLVDHFDIPPSGLEWLRAYIDNRPVGYPEGEPIRTLVHVGMPLAVTDGRTIRIDPKQWPRLYEAITPSLIPDRARIREAIRREIK